MASIKKRLAAVAAAAGLTIALGGCMGDYGYGSIGYASDYYGGYDYGPSVAYGGYGGWFDNFYYPGYGVYVFDRGGHRSRWNDGQRRYWQGRREHWQGQRWNGHGSHRDGRRHLSRPDGVRSGRDWQRSEGRRRWYGSGNTARVPHGGSATVGAERSARHGTSAGQWRGRRGAGTGQGARSSGFHNRTGDRHQHH